MVSQTVPIPGSRIVNPRPGQRAFIVDALGSTARMNPCPSLLFKFMLAAVIPFFGISCGPSSKASSPIPLPVRVNPERSSVKPGGSAVFRLLNELDQPVSARFTVQEAQGGTVSVEGVYQAPLTVGLYHLLATPLNGATGTATAQVDVLPYEHVVAPRPDLSFGRLGHTASIRSDGSIVIIGGAESPKIECYSSSTKQLSVIGQLPFRRWSHGASVLAQDRVLIMGGCGASGATNSATLLDPAGEWIPAGSMNEARMNFATTLIGNDKVLVTGGMPAPGSDVMALRSAEVYNPEQRGFVPVGAMSVPRSGHTATRLQDGRVLIVGGRDSTCVFNCPEQVWNSAELFDPATGEFKKTGPMAQARYGHSATLLPDGRILIAGGITPELPDTDITRSVEIYDPVTGSFSTVGSMIRPRAEHTATLLPDGRVVLAFGRTFGEGTMASSTIEIYDLNSGKIVTTASPQHTRYRHTGTLLPNGEVVWIGGSEGGVGLRAIEIFQ